MLNNIHDAPLHKVRLFLNESLRFQEGRIMIIFILSAFPGTILYLYFFFKMQMCIIFTKLGLNSSWIYSVLLASDSGNSRNSGRASF